ncbi:hypothetical protein BGZ81_003616 [Podila clonocystis]|nr:hypothetical protein BGZ81_003616 [Podila clonocystis]
MPKPRIQVQSVANQKKPSLGFLASSSSFFESSPRTPRIMPFSQHHANISDDWSVRARSSSIAAPLTPLLESDCADPMDYFGGSRSANSSRRGSVENNLTESLLSGRARMFASEPNMTNSRQSDLSDLTSSGGSVSNPTLNESTFLSHSHYGSLEPSTTASAFTNMMSNNLAQHSTLDSGLSSNMGSMPGIFPTEESVAPAFVNPWDPPLQYHSHAGSETFLPFGSTSNYDTSSTADLEVGHRRQASLLKLMNGDRDDASLGIHGGASGEQKLRSLNTFGNGFLFPSRDPLTTTSTLPESSSTGGYQPFASIEMSLAAAANQCPVLEDDPKYDFVELAIQSSDFANKKRFDALEGHHNHRGDGHQGPEKKSRGRHGRTRSGHHKSASLGSFFPPMPPNTSSSSSGLPESHSTPGIQGASGNTDPLRGRHHHGQGQGQGQGHSKQGKRHVTESSLSRENSHVDRRRGTKTSGADSDSNHRGNKHQDTKSKRVHKE